MTELHPDLIPHVRDYSFGRFVHHPLLVSLYDEALNDYVNRAYLQKRQMVETARKNKDITKFLVLHERAYRLPALLEAKREGMFEKPAAYWKSVANVWQGSENNHQDLDQWIEIWEDNCPDRRACMSRIDCKALYSLADRVTIFRGGQVAQFQKACPGRSHVI